MPRIACFTQNLMPLITKPNVRLRVASLISYSSNGNSEYFVPAAADVRHAVELKQTELQDDVEFCEMVRKLDSNGPQRLKGIAKRRSWALSCSWHKGRFDVAFVIQGLFIGGIHRLRESCCEQSRP